MLRLAKARRSARADRRDFTPHRSPEGQQRPWPVIMHSRPSRNGIANHHPLGYRGKNCRSAVKTAAIYRRRTKCVLNFPSSW
jgi:hypothetical protein